MGGKSRAAAYRCSKMKRFIIRLIAMIITLFLNRKDEEIIVDKPKQQDDVRRAGATKVGKPPKLPLLAIVATISLFGCQDSHKVIIVEQEGVVRLLEDSKKVKVLIQTDDGWVQGKTVIPAGWYAMSLTDDEISEANDGR